MYTSIRVLGSPDAQRRELGYVLERPVYRVPIRVTKTLTAGPLQYVPVEEPAHPAPPVLVRSVLDAMPKFAVPENAAPLSPEQVQRRHGAMPERPGPRDFDLLGEGKKIDEEAYEHVRASFGFPTSLRECVYPFDGEGGKLDAAHDHAVHRAAQAARRAVREQAEAVRENDRPLSELGRVAILVEHGGRMPYADAAFVAGTTLRELMTKASAAIEDEAGFVWLFRAPPLPIPEGRIPRSDAFVLPSGYVPKLTKADIKSKTLNAPLAAMLELRRVPATPVDPARLRDGRTAEGEHAEMLFRAEVEKHKEALESSRPHEKVAVQRLLSQIGVRGLLLAPELVLGVLSEHLPMIPGPKKVTSRFVNESGEEVRANEVKRIPAGQAQGGQPYRVVGRVRSNLSWSGGYASPEGVEQVEYLTEHFTEETMPMVRSGDADIKHSVQQALTGKHPWVDIDELYTDPLEDFFTKWTRRLFGTDGDWQTRLREVTKDRDQVTTDELVRGLVDTGLIEHARAEDYTKIRKLMTDDGWVHRQVPGDGKRERRWCRK